MKIKLNNGTELEAFAVNGQARHFQGATRDSLEFVFLADSTTFQELESLFNDENSVRRIELVYPAKDPVTGEIITDGEGNVVMESSWHNHYTLPVSISTSFVVIEPATVETPAVTAKAYSVIMAQKTYAELQLESLQETVDILVLESLGLEV